MRRMLVQTGNGKVTVIRISYPVAGTHFISLTQPRGAFELYQEIIAMTLKIEPDLGSPALPWDDTFDTIVLGSGLAGLTAALVSTIEGKKTVAYEMFEQLGG